MYTTTLCSSHTEDRKLSYNFQFSISFHMIVFFFILFNNWSTAADLLVASNVIFHLFWWICFNVCCIIYFNHSDRFLYFQNKLRRKYVSERKCGENQIILVLLMFCGVYFFSSYIFHLLYLFKTNLYVRIAWSKTVASCLLYCIICFETI